MSTKSFLDVGYPKYANHTATLISFQVARSAQWQKWRGDWLEVEPSRGEESATPGVCPSHCASVQVCIVQVCKCALCKCALCKCASVQTRVPVVALCCKCRPGHHFDSWHAHERLLSLPLSLSDIDARTKCTPILSQYAGACSEGVTQWGCKLAACARIVTQDAPLQLFVAEKMKAHLYLSTL